jgi:membrane protease YdiL (CAAX protease family)
MVRTAEAAGLIHHLLAFFLILFIPVWDRLETRRLRADRSSASRIRSYRMTIAFLWTATLLLLATTPWSWFGTAPGVPFHSHRAQLIVAGALAAAFSLGIVAPVIMAARSPEMTATMREQLARLDFFLPQTPRERPWFAALSVSAAICEEILFRGFLPAYFMVFGLAPVAAFLLAAVVFGIDHGYQGWTGVALTGAIALIFTALFVLSGSLWLPMVVHALLDLRILVLLRGAD